MVFCSGIKNSEGGQELGRTRPLCHLWHMWYPVFISTNRVTQYGMEPECGLPSSPLTPFQADGERKGQQTKPAGTWGPGPATSCAVGHGEFIPCLYSFISFSSKHGVSTLWVRTSGMRCSIQMIHRHSSGKKCLCLSPGDERVL